MSKPTEYKKAVSRLLKLHKCVVPKRSGLPILQCVRLFERNSRLVIQSTDLEQRLETTTPAFAEAGFEFIVRLKALEAYLSLYKDWPEFRVGKSASSSSVTMVEMHHEKNIDRIFPDFDNAEFPVFKFGEPEASVPLSAGDIEKLKSLLPFAGDLGIPTVSGVYLSNDKAVSTDKTILAYANLETDTHSDIILTPSTIRFMSKLGSAIEFSVNDEQTLIRTDDVIYKAKSLSGKFPDWKSVIPTGEPAVRLDFDHKMAAELINKRKKQFAATNNNLPPEYMYIGLSGDRIAFVLSNEKFADPQEDFPGKATIADVGRAHETVCLKTEHLEKILKLGGDRIELRFHAGRRNDNGSLELDASGISLVLAEFVAGAYKGLFRLILT